MPSIIVTAALGVGTLILLWRNSVAGFLCACAWLIISPTLVVPMPTELIAERRMYLPLAALTALLIVGGYRLLQEISRRDSSASRKKFTALWLPLAAVFSVTIIWSVMSARRLDVYRDAITLWEDAVAAQPDDPVARTNLAVLLNKAGRTSEAIEQLNHALAIRSDFPKAQNDLGVALASAGQSEDAIKRFEKAIELAPDYAEPHHNLAIAYAKSGRIPQAIAELQQALQLNPRYAKAHLDLGTVLAATGRLTEAVQHYQQAAQLKPNMPDSYFALALLYEKMQQPADAITAAQQALRVAQANQQAALARNIQLWLNSHRAAGISSYP